MDQDQWNKGRLLELSGQYWKSSTLHAGIKLGLFTAIGSDIVTGRELARKLDSDERGITMLSNALTAMGLLKKSGDQFINTPESNTFLSKKSPNYIGYIIIHHQHLVESWAKLDQAVKEGTPVRKNASHNREEWRENFLMGMFNVAMNSAPVVAKAIDLAQRRHLLDLGGGPGTYAIHFCLANPQLKATVYDLPTTEPFAKKTIDKFNVHDRVDFMSGDYLEDDIKGKYDVAWLSHILHGESPQDCQRIIKKTVAAMEPSGMILIHDFILNNTMDGPLFPALFSLNMLLGTSEGQSYSEEQIMAMLAKSGARDIKRLSFTGPNDAGIIAGLVK